VEKRSARRNAIAAMRSGARQKRANGSAARARNADISDCFRSGHRRRLKHAQEAMPASLRLRSVWTNCGEPALTPRKGKSRAGLLQCPLRRVEVLPEATAAETAEATAALEATEAAQEGGLPHRHRRRDQVDRAAAEEEAAAAW